MNYLPNSRFADYVTNIAFNLTLSRSMCSYLLAICDDAKSGRRKSIFESGATSGYRDFIMTGRSLESRGLIWRDEYMIGNHVTAMWMPTEEGKLVAELVRRAIPGYQPVPVQKKTRKKA